MDIKNKVVCITGGATGIGLATAQKMLSQGAKVGIIALTIPDTAQIKELAKRNDVVVCQGDIQNAQEMKTALNTVVDTLGSVDVFINNAAVTQRKSFEETERADWDFIIDVNIKGTLCATKEALTIMRRQGHGIIITISSGAGLYGIKNLSLYSLAKAALINFSQSLADEVRDQGITVFTVTPGSTNTSLFSSCFPQREAQYTPEQIADVIAQAVVGDIHPDERLIIDVFKHAR